MNEAASTDGPVLVISDDMCSHWKKEVEPKLFDKMISTSRHIGKGMSFVFLSQSIVQLPTSLRRNTTCFVIFGATSFAESELIWRDISTVDKKTFNKIFRSATQKQFGFLVAVNDKGQLRFFDSFEKEFEIDWSN